MPEATAADIARLRTYGQSIGLAFQIVDDVLDVTQTSEQLGKTAGKDAAAEKTTIRRCSESRNRSARPTPWSIKPARELNEYGEAASTLKDLAHYLVERKK